MAFHCAHDPAPTRRPADPPAAPCLLVVAAAAVYARVARRQAREAAPAKGRRGDVPHRGERVGRYGWKVLSASTGTGQFTTKIAPSVSGTPGNSSSSPAPRAAWISSSVTSSLGSTPSAQA
jgi:hypothetical protein